MMNARKMFLTFLLIHHILRIMRRNKIIRLRIFADPLENEELQFLLKDYPHQINKFMQ